MKKYILFLSLFGSSSLQAQEVVLDKPYNQQIGSSFDFVGIGDVNGDGLNDIAGATTFYFDPANDHRVFLWLQGANGQLKAPLKFPYPRPGQAPDVARSLTVCDLYDDGTAEILLGVGGRLNIYSWINDGLVLTDSLTTIVNYAQNGVTTGDFDGDGFTDIGVSHWGGQRLTVIYQHGEATKWDIRHYSMNVGGRSHVTAGKFGPLQQTALILANSIGSSRLSVITFTTTRSISNKYDLQMPDTWSPASAAIVKKGSGKPAELWAIHGGNSPSARISVWRGLQSSPDTTFRTYEIPEAIQSANLDCDYDDEPVIVHGGWNKMTVYATDTTMYSVYLSSHIEADGIALGDVNNDRRIDVVLAKGITANGLAIFYNITSPCWPAAVPEDRYIANQLLLFPNPANDQVAIVYRGAGALNITDAQGRVIYQSRFDTEASVDISRQPSGIYFAVLHSTDGRILSTKFIKQ